MTVANNKLYEVIEKHKDELITEICNRLQKLSSSHYEMIDFERHQEREEEFLDIIIKVIHENNERPLKIYMENLARQRSNEGYSLEEVQNAIRIFEEEFWDILVTHYPVSKELVELLTDCNMVFGLARDYFAQYYMDKTIAMQNELNSLKERFYKYKQGRKDLTGNEAVDQ
ncbi:MAG TPA: hypothetical protein PLP19_00175 [bacterium]|nr:hypothetical protein [bacterium]HPN41883.1 hypothetical protein [bacterium]